LLEIDLFVPKDAVDEFLDMVVEVRTIIFAYSQHDKELNDLKDNFERKLDQIRDLYPNIQDTLKAKLKVRFDVLFELIADGLDPLTKYNLPHVNSEVI
jgi:hypothetical protein